MEEEFVLSDFLKQKMDENIQKLKETKYIEEKQKKEEEIEEIENEKNPQIKKKKIITKKYKT